TSNSPCSLARSATQEATVGPNLPWRTLPTRITSLLFSFTFVSVMTQRSATRAARNRPPSGWPSQGHLQPWISRDDVITLDRMGTPLGDFVRAKRDSLQPEDVGLPLRSRRRAPGLRRSELADRAGISVEYLSRVEQGRDRNPSIAIINALSDALLLDAAERRHLSYLAK